MIQVWDVLLMDGWMWMKKDEKKAEKTRKGKAQVFVVLPGITARRPAFAGKW